MGNALLCEYESIIDQPHVLKRCPLSKNEIERLLNSFMSICEWVSIHYLWRPNLKDEADNHLIELAVAGGADAIVTNNVRDFKNTELLFPEIKIIKSEDLLIK